MKPYLNIWLKCVCNPQIFFVFPRQSSYKLDAYFAEFCETVFVTNKLGFSQMNALFDDK